MSKTPRKSKKQKTPAGTKITREFEFALTEQEFSEKGKAAAELSGEVESLHLQFEEVKQTWKAKINARESKRDETLSVIRAKKEKRQVEAVLVKNYDAKEIEYWFDGEVLEKRTMTESELQVEINLEKNAKQARAVRQKIQKPTHVNGFATGEGHLTAPKVVNGQGEDISQVMREETTRRTKLSAVDGPVQ